MRVVLLLLLQMHLEKGVSCSAVPCRAKWRRARIFTCQAVPGCHVPGCHVPGRARYSRARMSRAMPCHENPCHRARAMPHIPDIYIYTSVNPCITCTRQGGAEQKMMPIKDEQGAGFLERPFRAQETNAPHGCGLERHFSSMLRLQDRLERPPSSVLWLQGRFERHPSSILRFRGGSRGARRAFCGSRAGSRGTRRVFCGSGAGSSGRFEPSAAPGRARAAISSHLRPGAGFDDSCGVSSSQGQQRSSGACKPP